MGQKKSTPPTHYLPCFIQYLRREIDLEKLQGVWRVHIVGSDTPDLPIPPKAHNPHVEFIIVKYREEHVWQKVKMKLTYNALFPDGEKMTIVKTLYVNEFDGKWEIRPFWWRPYYKEDFIVLQLDNRADDDDKSGRYNYMLIGDKDRHHYWALGRKKFPDTASIDTIDILDHHGYDTVRYILDPPHLRDPRDLEKYRNPVDPVKDKDKDEDNDEDEEIDFYDDRYVVI